MDKVARRALAMVRAEHKIIEALAPLSARRRDQIIQLMMTAAETDTLDVLAKAFQPKEPHQ